MEERLTCGICDKELGINEDGICKSCLNKYGIDNYEESTEKIRRRRWRG